MSRPGTSNVRLAIDIGGTFTDTALAVGKSLTTAKTLTTASHPVDGVLEGVHTILADSGIKPGEVVSVVHGTTLATNALIERKGAKLGLVTTRGFRDILEIAYERRYDQYAINLDKPDMLVPRERCYTIAERLDANGDVVEPLDETEIDKFVERLKADGVESLAICLLHSYANAAHEERLRELIRARHPDISITLSSKVCPEIREYDRCCTAIANAYIKPLMSRYLQDLQNELAREGFTCPLYIMTSGGGMTTVDTAVRFPIRLVESGPSGGAILAATIARQCGVQEAVSFDMGGTTAKVCLIDDAKPQKSREFEIARAARFMKGSGLPVRIPVIEMIEIGAGGGSVATVDSLERIAVGPESAGADPGPVCYGRGGEAPTVTDSDVALGLIDPKKFAEGRVSLDKKAAVAAVAAQIGGRLGVGTATAAYGISQMVDENMANAARVHAVEHAKELTTRSLIAFGGNGPLHASRVADKIGVSQIIIPRDPGVGSAVGFLSAPISFEIIRSLYMTIETFNAPAVARLFAAMEKKATGVVRAGAPKGGLQKSRVAFMRYEGQGHEIEVPVPNGRITAKTGTQLLETYTALYLKLFGRTVPNVDIEILNWAVTVSTEETAVAKLRKSGKTTKPAANGSASVYLGGAKRASKVPSFDRDHLKIGDRIEGPALIVEPQTTTLVGPRFDAVIDRGGNIVMNRQAQAGGKS